MGRRRRLPSLRGNSLVTFRSALAPSSQSNNIILPSSIYHHTTKKYNLVEDNSLVSVEQDSPLSEVLHRRSQDIALNVGSSMSQLLGAHSVVDTHNILLNNRTLIQITGDKVRRSTDNLDTAVKSLVVRLSTLETGQETVMNVDDLSRHGLAQHRRQHLHVAGQDNQINVVFADQLQDASLLLGLGVGGHGEMQEGDVVGSSQGSEVGVVGNNEGDLDGELASRGAEEEVVEAVADLRDHDQHAGLGGGGDELEGHGQGLGGGLESGAQVVEGLGGRGFILEVHAHEEALAGRVAVLAAVDDVEVLLHQVGGHGVDNARAVGAGEGENVAHCGGGGWRGVP